MYRIIQRNGRYIPQVQMRLFWYGIREKGFFRKYYGTWSILHEKYCSYHSLKKAKQVIEGYKETLKNEVVWEEPQDNTYPRTTDIDLNPYGKEGRAGPRPGY